jgi:hypothetical protein
METEKSIKILQNFIEAHKVTSGYAELQEVVDACEALINANKQTAIGFAEYLFSRKISKMHTGKIGEQPQAEDYHPSEFQLMLGHLRRDPDSLFNEWMGHEPDEVLGHPELPMFDDVPAESEFKSADELRKEYQDTELTPSLTDEKAEKLRREWHTHPNHKMPETAPSPLSGNDMFEIYHSKNPVKTFKDKMDNFKYGEEYLKLRKIKNKIKDFINEEIALNNARHTSMMLYTSRMRTSEQSEKYFNEETLAKAAKEFHKQENKMDDSKYYTPDISEFHDGFEFEIVYTEKVVKTDCFNAHFGGFEQDVFDNLKAAIETKLVRVKYLDEDDIKECGFEPLNNMYICKANNITYWLIPIHEDFGKHKWEIRPSQPSSLYSAFLGVIKNKSEFKKLLTQLQIL